VLEIIILDDMLRVFLSVDIEDETLLDRIVASQNKLDRDAAKMKLVERENIHFTWRFFGDTPMHKIDEIRSELAGLEWAPFTIQVDGVGAFPSLRRPRVIWIGVTENAEKMVSLKTDTDGRLVKLGYPPEKKFTPHATIARIRFVKDAKNLTKNLEGLARESIGPMEVASIRMTKSTLTPSGSVYETLWEVPFK
jgi:2'-5' RNA ligase